MNNETTLIDAPHGVLEVDAIWQKGYRQPTDTLALLCHPNPIDGGTMMNKVVSTMYRFCRDANMDVVRFNYRGVGRSSGVSEYGDGEFMDAQTVLKWAMSRTNARVLWLGGFSFGGFIACRMADLLDEHQRTGGVFESLRLDNLALIAPSVVRNDASRLTINAGHAFVIYGDNDGLVAPALLHQFAVHRGFNQAIIAGAGHLFHGKLTDLKQALIQNTKPSKLY
ncbi:alpha/beta fold hydrolase [Moraxella haemolytica]|uniref:alpha/beta hydrolase n=1 Tax=Moraxella TaxID=475 RepID=UPI002542F718|nr:alpha/beta fold hydrolase [Moraxella sp. ZY171148]WII94414.1 alpha/beta fold hydrolase [Moraxella sp. ZY171148]